MPNSFFAEGAPVTGEVGAVAKVAKAAKAAARVEGEATVGSSGTGGAAWRAFDPAILLLAPFCAGFRLSVNAEGLTGEACYRATFSVCMAAVVLVSLAAFLMGGRAAVGKTGGKGLHAALLASSAVLVAFAVAGALAFPWAPHGVCRALGVAFACLLGAALSLGVVGWVDSLADGPFGRVAVTLPAVVLVFAGLCVVGEAVPAVWRPAYSSAVMAVGALPAARALRNGVAGRVAGRAAGGGSAGEDGEGPTARGAARRVLCSVSCVGVLFACFIDGASHFYEVDLAPATSSLAILAALAVVMAVVTAWRLAEECEANQAFALFHVVVPAVVTVALFVKVIPFELVTSMFFRDYLNAILLFVVPVGIAHLAYLLGADRGREGCVFAFLMACGAVFFVGSAAGRPGDFWSQLWTGVAAALFLVFSSVHLGRITITYFRGTEVADEMTSSEGLGVDDACGLIAQERGLTPREREVFLELAHGHSSSYIASLFVISENTVHTHMKSVYRKLGVGSRYELLEAVRRRQEAGAAKERDAKG